MAVQALTLSEFRMVQHWTAEKLLGLKYTAIYEEHPFGARLPLNSMTQARLVVVAEVEPVSDLARGQQSQS